jgi:hypothetical protein
MGSASCAFCLSLLQGSLLQGSLPDKCVPTVGAPADYSERLRFLPLGACDAPHTRKAGRLQSIAGWKPTPLLTCHNQGSADQTFHAPPSRGGKLSPHRGWRLRFRVRLGGIQSSVHPRRCYAATRVSCCSLPSAVAFPHRNAWLPNRPFVSAVLFLAQWPVERCLGAGHLRFQSLQL